MVTLQILSKIIQTSSNAIVEENYLTEDYFAGYENEFNFIQEHLRKYGNVPDKATFLAAFPGMELVDVNESDRYLIDTVREEHLYTQSVPVLKEMANLMQTDSNTAVQYMMSQMNVLQPNYSIGGVNIIKQAKDRFAQYIDRKNRQKDYFFESGFKELDEIIYGLQRGEEFFVIVARTNQGKSWVLEKMCTHVWGCGFNVGYVSPEMSATSIGFRFDTLFNHFSNRSLMRGKDDIDESEYEKYIDDLATKENVFEVATPSDFGNKVTVTALKNWIRAKKLDLIAIDGITYMTDERGGRNDNKSTTLTNISEDLMSLSVELKVPVLVVVQANRSGVGDKEEAGTPEIESIKDSDGIAHNASIIISIHQKKNGVLEMGIKKQRFGSVGGKLNYAWDIDKGDYVHLPANDDAEPTERTRKKVEETRKKYKDKSDVF